MPRRSAADLSIVTPLARTARLRPHAGMSSDVRAQFLQIVDSMPADGLRESDRPLVERLATLRAAMERPDIALSDYLQCIRVELALCRALRAMPLSRGNTRATGAMKVRPLTAAEFLEQDGDDDDDTE